MKQKQIEKIPYMTLPERYPDKKAKFVGRTACLDIGNEPHIILEIYKNNKSCMRMPELRYVATRKDWGMYDPSEGEWSRKSIKTYCYGGDPCWYEGTYKDREKENCLFSSEDMARIRKFFKGITVWTSTDWWDYFKRNEEEIKNAERKRKYERRMERLEERKRNTPELDEKAMLDWADSTLFYRKHYLFYRKKGRKATICCSSCGGVYNGSWRTGQTYESMFEKYIEEPVGGQTGRCILCGGSGEYKPQGKAKTAYRMRDHVFLADRYLENGVVVRYIELGKEWQLEEMAAANGKAEMYGACEKLDGIEIARAYFLPGKKVQTDYHKHDPYEEKDFWDDCNLYGNANIVVKEAGVHPASWKNLKGTFLQYSALEEYAAAKRKVNVLDYLERYIHFPQIEMLVKMKMYQVAEHIVKGYCGIIWSERSEKPDEFLGIRKDKLKLLAEEQGSVTVLAILKEEKRLGQNWTWQQVRELAEMNAAHKNLEMVLQVMSIQKLLNAIKKYAGCEYGTGCANAEHRLKMTAGIYFDYFSMRRSLGFDMKNTVYQKPRDLVAAHNKMVAEQNKGKADKRIREVEEMFPDIRKNYRKLRKRYFYEDDTYLIRPARSAEEIVLEGRLLHHCVGGNNYLRKHNSGETYILMLRFKENPEIPYITVEIDGTGRILQWYGQQDGKPDKDNMQKWLDIYVTKLKSGLTGTGNQTEITEKVLLMAAG